MKIVFDTNALYGNWYLNGPKFRLIEEAIKCRICKLIVPEIVLLELLNNYRKLILEGHSSLSKLNKLISGLGFEIADTDSEKICQQYEKALR